LKVIFSHFSRRIQVNSSLKVSIKQNQFDALVSLTFNAGPKAVAPHNAIMGKINGGRVVEQVMQEFLWKLLIAGAPPSSG
jgi:GH24 family phage-related lysozyme (muramidase)